MLAGTELARAFAVAARRPVRFEQQPLDELAARNAENAKMFGWFATSGYQADVPSLRRIHPTLTTFADWLATGGWPPARR